MSGSMKVTFWRHRYAMVFQAVWLCCIVVWKCVQRSSCRLGWWVGSPQTFMYYMGSTCLKWKGWILWSFAPIGPMVSMSYWSYVVPSSVLSIYHDKISLKFASHHFLLYAVYICQKSLNFTYAFKCYQQNLSWLHFCWTTLYMSFMKYVSWHIQLFQHITSDRQNHDSI